MKRCFRVLGLLMSAAAGLAIGGCKKAEPAPAAAMKPPEVFVTTPTMAEITDFEDFTGRTKARRTIEIRARVTGYIDKIQFKDGGEVKQGDVLFEIDPRPYQRDVERAAATLEQAQAHLKRLERDYERANNLIASKQISREQFDLVVGDRAESDAAVRVATANLGTANLHLGYTKVKSPLSRANQPHPARSGQSGQSGRHDPHDAGHAGPDVRLLRDRRADAVDDAPLRRTRQNPHRPGAGSARLDGTGRRRRLSAPRHRSTSSTTSWTSPPAPCRCAGHLQIRTTCFRRACSSACDCRSATPTRRF